MLRIKRVKIMKKHRFVIVGSGWRSLCYVRIAKALPEVFELCAMLCRTEEKAERMAKENDIYTTTSIEECKAMNSDFVVVVVNKTPIADVSKEWMEYGFTVLCETPAALDTDTLNELWAVHNSGGRLMVAEQYRSPIRNNYVKLQFARDSDNPNLKMAYECEAIRLVQEAAEDEVVYEAPFGLCGMNKGETAVAMLMVQAAEYDRKAAEQALRDTLQDAYMAILMKQAVETGEVVASQVQSWHEA